MYLSIDTEPDTIVEFYFGDYVINFLGSYHDTVKLGIMFSTLTKIIIRTRHKQYIYNQRHKIYNTEHVQIKTSTLTETIDTIENISLCHDIIDNIKKYIGNSTIKINKQIKVLEEFLEEPDENTDNNTDEGLYSRNWILLYRYIEDTRKIYDDDHKIVFKSNAILYSSYEKCKKAFENYINNRRIDGMSIGYLKKLENGIKYSEKYSEKYSQYTESNMFIIKIYPANAL